MPSWWDSEVGIEKVRHANGTVDYLSINTWKDFRKLARSERIVFDHTLYIEHAFKLDDVKSQYENSQKKLERAFNSYFGGMAFLTWISAIFFMLEWLYQIFFIFDSWDEDPVFTSANYIIPVWCIACVFSIVAYQRCCQDEFMQLYKRIPSLRKYFVDLIDKKAAEDSRHEAAEAYRQKKLAIRRANLRAYEAEKEKELAIRRAEEKATKAKLERERKEIAEKQHLRAKQENNFRKYFTDIISQSKLQKTLSNDFIKGLKNALTKRVGDGEISVLKIWGSKEVNKEMILEIWKNCNLPNDNSDTISVPGGEDFDKSDEVWCEYSSILLDQTIQKYCSDYKVFLGKMIENISILNGLKSASPKLLDKVFKNEISWKLANEVLSEYDEHPQLIQRWADGEDLDALLVEFGLQ